MADRVEVTNGSEREGLFQLVTYFLRLGTIGFGGPVALVGFMRRDLVEQRQWIHEDTFKLALALAQIMPGPLAAQTAIAIGYFQAGILGATLVGIAFILPSFLMVVALSMLYVAYGGLWWMQALFYGIGAAVVAIIAIAAYKLAKSTNKRDPLLWGLFLVVLTATVFAQAELAWLFVVAGLVTLIVNAPPAWLKRKVPYLGIMPWPFLTIGSLGHVLPTVTGPSVDTLVSLLLFFVKAGAFVFGSGLAIVPFLYEGVVKQYHWLNEPQFRDAVAIAMITPGPVVITVAFIGYVVAGFAGAVVAAVGIFLPVYVLTIGPARWFRNNRDNVQLKAFVQGATAAATGAISGAVVVIGARTLVDVPTVLIAIASLAVLLRFKVQEPLLVTAAGLAGLVVFPLLHGGG